jgi:hypothetical protein
MFSAPCALIVAALVGAAKRRTSVFAAPVSALAEIEGP